MLRAPEPLTPDHDIAGFDCGVASLNSWLERRATANQVSGASRTFVASEDRKVVGYFALASSAVAPGRRARPLPPQHARPGPCRRTRPAGRGDKAITGRGSATLSSRTPRCA